MVYSHYTFNGTVRAKDCVADQFRLISQRMERMTITRPELINHAFEQVGNYFTQTLLIYEFYQWRGDLHFFR